MLCPHMVPNYWYLAQNPGHKIVLRLDTVYS